MTDYDKIISDLESALSDALKKLRSKIDRAVSEAVAEYDLTTEPIKMQIAMLRQMKNYRSEAGVQSVALTSRAEMRSGCVKNVEAAEANNVGNERRSAKEVILTALLAGPLHATEVDTAVIREGWTKAASEKAKSLLHRDGLVVAEKRKWSITANGRKSVLGKPGS